MRWSVARLLEGYYLATPLFVLADVYLAAPIRLVALADSRWRWGYYAAAFGCGFLCRWKPRAAPAVGVVESSLNLLLVFLAVLLPVWSMPELALAGEPLVGPFETVGVMNILLSGTVFIIAFHRSRGALLGE